MRGYPSRIIGVVALVLLIAVPAHAQLTSRVVATGLTNPLAMAVDPLDPSIFFVVEQRGLVRVVRNGAILQTPFLDLRDQITSGGERGLLGMAFEPERGRVFVNFTNRDGHTVVARYRRSSADPLVADVPSRRDLVWPDGRSLIEQPFSNHNGGDLVFGPDGYLYIGLGDGGSGGDPMHFAQDPQSLLGKMLRLDVNVDDDHARGYRVPPANPFLDAQPVSALGEIWAFGLRNPWRYTFDDPARGGTGALVIADVGQGAREEVDYQPPGVGAVNYGWRLREGTAPYDDRRPAAFEPLTEPIHDYGRSIGQSISGGYVYRGAALDPSFVGRYFFADFVTARVFSLALDQTPGAGTRASDIREHTEAIGNGRRIEAISSFGVDANGELYVLDYDAGAILQIVPDMSIMPGVPESVRMSSARDIVALTWLPPSDGRPVIGYVVETTTSAGVHALRTIDIGNRRHVNVRLSVQEPCARVRAVGRSGVGAPSQPVCVQTTP